MSSLSSTLSEQNITEPEVDLMIRVHPDCPHNDPILSPAREGDAGYDLRVWIDTGHPTVLRPHEMSNFRTGVYVKIPEGYWGAIRPRSSTFAKKQLLVMGGTIDEGYTGEISIFIWNPMNNSISVEDGDRLAQLLLIPRFTPPIKIVGQLPETQRGTEGFGSTGD